MQIVLDDEERAAAKALGFEDGPPLLRYDLPPAAPRVEKFMPTHWKAVQLIDPIATAAFEKFIPDIVQIDQTEDARAPKEGCMFGTAVRTDWPPPSNRQIQNSLKIIPGSRSRENYMRWLGVVIADTARELGCFRIAPPLIFECLGDPDNPLAPPYIGVILKFLRKPADGQRLIDQMGDVGALRPVTPPLADGSGDYVVLPAYSVPSHED